MQKGMNRNNDRPGGFRRQWGLRRENERQAEFRETSELHTFGSLPNVEFGGWPH